VWAAGPGENCQSKISRAGAFVNLWIGAGAARSAALGGFLCPGAGSEGAMGCAARKPILPFFGAQGSYRARGVRGCGCAGFLWFCIYRVARLGRGALALDSAGFLVAARTGRPNRPAWRRRRHSGRARGEGAGAQRRPKGDGAQRRRPSERVARQAGGTEGARSLSLWRGGLRAPGVGEIDRAERAPCIGSATFFIYGFWAVPLASWKKDKRRSFR
jgi:hypothetical protein